MPRASISISGLNSLAVPVCDLARAALFFSISLSLVSPPFTRAQEPAAPASAPIRVTVDRVNVGVIVTDPSGNFAEGLQREDFHVFNDGVEQPLTDFAAVEEPAQVLLLVEAGPAVYFLEASHLQAAHALLDGLSAGDQVAVVKYDEAAQVLLNFTANKQSAEAALAKVRFNLGFGNLNLSRSLAAVLDWLAKGQGKKTIVLLSTGVDTSPDNDAIAILERLKTTDVRLLAVSLSGELRNPPPRGKPNGKNKTKVPTEKSVAAEKGFAEADQLLKVITEATGGRAYFPNNTKDFSNVFAEIAQLVRHEYSLAFAPPAHDGKLHAIEVRVSQAPTATPNTPPPAYRVDYRRAYLAPQNQSIGLNR
jgi:Ca-activated chloride channel family protein